MVKFFKTPFASNGDKLNIPEELQEDGSISFDQGYGEDYEKNRKTDPDAKNISRQSFNGLLHDITDAIGDIQRSGVAKWSDEVTYNKGSLVWHNKSLYSSLLDSNKSQPPSASWTTLLTEESLDLTEYRKIDDNVFNGYLQVRSEHEGQGTGVFLQDTDGTVRGQVVATDKGLQLTQYPKDGGLQAFTFPTAGEGGEVVVDSSLPYLNATTMGLLPGVANASSNSDIIKKLDNAVVALPDGVWYFESNTDIPPAVGFVASPSTLMHFNTHIRTRQGGSSGSIDVPERYTQFVYFEQSNLKYYVNDVEEPNIEWLNYNTLEAPGTTRQDEVKFVIKDARVAANQFNWRSNVNISSPTLDWDSSRDNVSYGNYTLRNAIKANNNTVFGSKALMSAKTPLNETAIGFQALYRNEGHHNTAVGSIAGEWLDNGIEHTMIGAGAGAKWRTGVGSVAIGRRAGKDLSSPSYCTVVGYRANASTGYITAFGTTAVGAFAMDFNTGGDNVAVGYRALNCEYKGAEHKTFESRGNVSVGSQSMRYHQTGNSNVVVGAFASGTGTHLEKSVVLGSSSLYNPSSGAVECTLVGYRAGRNSGGKLNVYVGSDTGLDAKGEYNTYLGGYSGKSSTGSGNTAIGYQSGIKFGGHNNTAVGNGSAIGNSGGNNNTFVGTDAGKLDSSGSSEYVVSNSTCIGYDSRISGDNQVQLGNADTTTYVYGTVQNRSDARDKDRISELRLGLDFVMGLKPSEYIWNYREWEGKKQGKRKHVGFIAQDVLKVIDSDEYAFVQDHKVNGGADVLTIGYDEFIPVLAKAIQEQQEIINELRDELHKLKP